MVSDSSGLDDFQYAESKYGIQQEESHCNLTAEIRKTTGSVNISQPVVLSF
jgi:hypothetical protein